MNTVKNTAEELFNREVLDNDGDKIGKIENIYLDDATSAVKWLTVKTGLFGMKHVFIPVEALRNLDGELVLPYDKTFVKNAPHLDAEKHISPEEESELYSYYGIGENKNTNGLKDENSVENNRNIETPGDQHESHDNYAVNNTETSIAYTATDSNGLDNNKVTSTGNEYDDHTDEGLVLHEERVNVETERVEAGQARLHKTVVTEEKIVDVPVTREEAHIVREPLNEVVSGNELREEEVAVTLHEERPVVEKETIAVERVALDTQEVHENKNITVETAHEEVALEQDNLGNELRRDRDNFDS